ncbi:MAG: hypothetical protein P8N50_05440, partial [Actinomycetota bacterium]|nr:hypothetical protein [Actinomycetota bacterium]
KAAATDIRQQAAIEAEALREEARTKLARAKEAINEAENRVIAAAEQHAARIVSEASDVAAQTLRQAEADAAAIAKDSKDKATAAAERAIAQLSREVTQLQAKQYALRSEAGILETAIDEQRSQIGVTVETLNAALDITTDEVTIDLEAPAVVTTHEPTMT